uniref:Uncharacterized protein n=1 Tax=Helianthus annuus TaxID=4232 RepID=A0A251T1M0_HELAN
MFVKRKICGSQGSCQGGWKRGRLTGRMRGSKYETDVTGWILGASVVTRSRLQV